MSKNSDPNSESVQKGKNILRYFIYVSLATQAMSQDDLATLIEGSRVNNNQNDLTGLLMYKGPLSSGGDAYFLQMLEGPAAPLDHLVEKIKTDSRHKSFMVLEEGETESRTFPDWSMGLRHVDEDKLSHLEGYANLDSQAFWTSAENGDLKNALGVMQFFKDEDV